MAKKLFALENAELEGEVIELETPAEVGEVAQVESEMVPEVAETETEVAAIDEGMGAADQLEQVEEVVAQAAEGEGLDPVAAEAIKIAVEAICARIGANPKAVYSLYATENFSSASSRKANTKIALEGVGEFLKDLWKKIKAALSSLWAKVKAFWAKHVSSLGQVKKALESMKKTVSSSSGKFKGQPFIEKAPGALLAAFAGKGDLTEARVGAYVAAHGDAEAGKDEVVATASKGQAAAAKASKDAKGGAAAATEDLAALNKQLTDLSAEVKLGSSDKPLIGGVFITYSFEVNEDNVSVTVETDSIADKDTEAGVMLVAKDKLNAVLGKVVAVIDANIKTKAGMDKAQAEFEKAMKEIGDAVNATVVNSETAEAAKVHRKAMKAVYSLNTKSIEVVNKKTSLDVKMAKAVLAYCSLCVKNYE